MTQLDENTNAAEIDSPEHDRRAMLRKLAIGGAGAAIGAVALGKTAQAADDGPLLIGNTNEGTDPTILTKTGAAATETGPSAFSVGAAAPTTAPFPANVGGYGNARFVNGLHGSTGQAAGFGVVAANLAPAAASATDPAPKGLALATPNGAQAYFVAGSVAGPTPGLHLAGELYADSEGTLWFTVPVPAPAPAGTVRFVKLAGTPSSGTLHAITPQRVYDSRLPAYTPNGLLAPNTSRVVSVADGRSATGTVTLANAVPVGATAVEINLTAASPTNQNFLSVAPGDAASTNTSLLNWNADVTQIANSITVKLDAERRIKVFCGDQAGSTQFIVDVFGYYI